MPSTLLHGYKLHRKQLGLLRKQQQASAGQPSPSLAERRATFAPAGVPHPVPDDVQVSEVSAGGVPAHWLSAPGVDPGRIAVVGHSRNGKAALLAAAFDERIAMAIPLQAGCGGTAPSRGTVGESVKQILGYAPEELNGRLVHELIHPDDEAIDNDIRRELGERPDEPAPFGHEELRPRDDRVRGAIPGTGRIPRQRRLKDGGEPCLGGHRQRPQ